MFNQSWYKMVIRSIFTCKCGKTFSSGSKTRAACPTCGAYCRTRMDPPDELVRDPRLTLSKCQNALELIAERAAAQSCDDIDVRMAQIFTDALKYLTPALEASFIQQTDDDSMIEKLLGKDDASDPAQLLPHPEKTVHDGSKPKLIDISEISDS